MRIRHYSPITLLILLMVAVLLIKVYQHNRLAYLTYTYQGLARQHAQLLNECAQLRAQHHRIASSATIVAKMPAMKPLDTTTVVPLSTLLQ